MCGICCIFGPTENAIFKDKENLVSGSQLGNRGPDACHRTSTKVTNQIEATFCGFVLHIRGQLTPQPVTDQYGNILLWNGEVFDGLPELQENDNDTGVLLEQLSHCQSNVEFISLFSHLQGPWAFIYWQAAEKQLWFGRDVFGRRSLLWHLPESTDDVLVLSSVKVGPHKYTEIPSIGIFRVKSETKQLEDFHYQMILHPWKEAVWPATGEYFVDVLETKSDTILGSCPNIFLDISSSTPNTFLPSICKELPPSDYQLTRPENLDVTYLSLLWESNGELRCEAEKLIEFLGQCVKTRVLNQNKDYLLNKSQSVVCSDFSTLNIESNHNIPCKLNSPQGNVTEPYADSRKHLPLMTSDVETVFPPVVKPIPGVAASDQLFASEEMPPQKDNSIDSESVSSETKTAESVQSTVYIGDASVAILFSGGLDVTVIAALADRYVPPDEPIDLLNVAFATTTDKKPRNCKKGKQHKQSQQQQTTPEKSPFLVPDRLTGYAAIQELNRNRKWNFIEINVTLEELQILRLKKVRSLLYPLCSVLDDSIGCALWFAARGHGILANGAHKGELYRSCAKVVLCGMGADELFAGYSRHRACFSKHGWQGLIQEMQVEINRISARNLGRDDRIISDHGREARFPYLDEKVINFIAQIPVYKKADLTLPRGFGEKLLLRLCALKLGLTTTAVQPKRAIQFGSRIAKLENTKEKASDVCVRLTPRRGEDS